MPQQPAQPSLSQKTRAIVVVGLAMAALSTIAAAAPSADAKPQKKAAKKARFHTVEQRGSLALIRREFPWVLTDGHSPSLPFGRVVEGSLKERQVVTEVVDASGQKTRAVHEGPFGYTTPAGKVKWIDTQLALTTGGFSPVGVGYNVVMPREFADGIQFGDAQSTITIAPLNAANPRGSIVGDRNDRVLWSEGWKHTDIVAIALADGIKEHLIVRTPAAPKSFSWRVERPQRATTIVAADRSVKVRLATGDEVAILPPPSGVDAVGRSMQLWYTIKLGTASDTLTLNYSAGRLLSGVGLAPITYPLDLDPTYSDPDITPGVDAEFTRNFGHVEGSHTATSATVWFHRGSPAVTYQPGYEGVWRIDAPPPGAVWAHFSASVHGTIGGLQNVSSFDGVGRVYHSRGPGQAGAYSNSFSAPPQPGPSGSIYTRLQHRNNASTLSASFNATISNVVRSFNDVTAPTITGFSTPPGMPIPQTFTASMSFADGQSGCSSARIVIQTPTGAHVTQQQAGGCAINATFSLAPGDYYIFGVARDVSGLESVVQRGVFVASSTPTLRLDHPVDNEVKDQTLRVAGESLTYGLSHYEVAVDGNIIALLQPAELRFNRELNIAGIAEGSRQVSVSAVTVVGLRATQTRRITVDHDPPTVAITEPADGAVIGGPGKKFTATASDTATQVAVTLRIDAQDLDFIENPPFERTFDARSLSDEIGRAHV